MKSKSTTLDVKIAGAVAGKLVLAEAGFRPRTRAIEHMDLEY